MKSSLGNYEAHEEQQEVKCEKVGTRFRVL
jgi:hypothetical protein